MFVRIFYYFNDCIQLTRRSICSVPVPSAELRHDCRIGADDLEGSDGGDQQRIADRGGADRQHGAGVPARRFALPQQSRRGAGARRRHCRVQNPGTRDTHRASGDQDPREVSRTVERRRPEGVIGLFDRLLFVAEAMAS